MDYIGSYSKYLALAAALVGTFLYPHLKGTKAKYVVWMIWYSVLTEFVGEYYYFWFNRPNTILYNLYTLVSITFFLWWFRGLLSSNKRKKLVKYFIGVFWVANLINAILLNNVLYQPTNYAFVIGVIFLVITICYFFIEMFNKEVVLNIRDSIYFWFALGVLLFYATFLPFYVTTNFFARSAESFKILGVAVFMLNVIMNCCFILGFMKAKVSADQHTLNQRT